MNKYDKRHIQNRVRYERQIEALFDAAMLDTAKLTSVIGDLGDEPFSWNNYPLANTKIKGIIAQLKSNLTASIVNAVRSEWTLSNNKNNELCNQVFGSLADSLPEALSRRYYSNNEQARDAFIARKNRGLNLSDRVWKYTNQFKTEIEMALDIGIRDGKSSAYDIVRDLKEYLKYPDRLYRRVRDEHGFLHLSKKAKAFHPGRGVYRSSYMNARRLAATETNIAYRTADYLRWQQMDFVVGIEIKTSNNHPITDICDTFAGRYPKDFKFTGWHPLCRCHAVTILKTEDELAEDTQRILDGGEPQSGSVNEVTDVPGVFSKWVENNEDRISRAEKRGSLPYFITDNHERVTRILHPKSRKKTPLEIAAERHAKRTDEKVKRIEMIWRQKVISHIRHEYAQYGDNALMNSYIQSMSDCVISNDTTGFISFYHKVKALLKSMKRQSTSSLTFADEQIKRFAEMEKVLGIKRGTPMTLSEADEQKANPNVHMGREYQINCQTCAPTYVLRSQGFDVVATGNTPGSVQKWISHGHSFDIWENYDGTPAIPTLYRNWLDAKGYKNMTAGRYRSFFEETTTEPGIYITTIAWKGGGAHATIIQRFADGSLAYIEPQHFNGTIKRSIDELCKGGKTIIPTWSKRGIMRVDNKMLKRICKDGGKDYDIWSIFGIK